MSADLIEVAVAARTDSAALARLVEATSTRVRRACAALVDPASADDLAQETYLRAARSLGSYRGESSPVPWLITIARRVCAEEIAARQRRRDVHSRLRRQRRDAVTDPSVMAEVSDAIAALAPERREAFLLTAVAGMSYADAAAACRCPIGTIRSRVARARDDLMDALGEPAALDLNPASSRSLTAVG